MSGPNRSGLVRPNDPPVPSPTTAGVTALKPTDLLLGRRLVGGNPAPQPTTIPVAALQKHGIVFAGAGLEPVLWTPDDEQVSALVRAA